MKVNAKSYPHPVLGNGDDLGGLFGVEFSYELGREEVVLRLVFALQNAGVEDLIKKGRASFVTELECRSTFFRKSYATRERSIEIRIPAKFLRQKVVLGFYVCADQDIKGYKPTEPHPDYEGASFDIDAGDVLAVGGQSSFIADKAFDPLRPPVSSFMSIMEGYHHEGPMQLGYDSDKIAIVLSKADWKNYLEVRNQKAVQGILHSAIVFPALLDAIHKVQSQDSEFENMNWYGRLSAILEAKGLEEKDPFESAQKILDNPAARGFSGINTLINTADDDEEYE